MFIGTLISTEVEAAGEVKISPARTVAIVGSHPATRELAPYDDPSIEIWLFNESAMKPEVYRRWDGLIQIHSPEVYTSPDNWVNAGHWAWLQQDHGNKRIFMQDIDPRVPNSVRYPLDEILAMTPRRYLRSSPAMALALAIYLGYERIMLYGSDLTSNTEYQYQAVNLGYWIGFADGCGVDLDLRCWQSEFDRPIYGFDGELTLPANWFEERVRLVDGVWQNNDKILKRLTERIDVAMIDGKVDDVAKLSLELESVAQAAGYASGALSEAENYRQRTNPISRQEFERRSAYAQQQYNDELHKAYHAGGKCEYVWNVWRQTRQVGALNQLRGFLKEKMQAFFDTGARQGIYEENITSMLEYDKLLEAAGGKRALGKTEDKHEQG